MGQTEKKALLISCFDWYEERVCYVEEYLKEKGYQTKVLLSDFNHHSKNYEMKYSMEAQIEYIHVRAYKKNLSVARLRSHLGFAKDVENRLKEWEPQLVYCLIPPNSLVKLLGRQKKRESFRLLYDVIDLWPESFPKGNTAWLPFRIWRNMRNKTLNRAEGIVLECNYYKNVLKTVVSEEKLRVFPLVKKALPGVQPVVFSQDKIILAYLGSINNLIDGEGICEVVRRLQKLKPVEIRIIGDGECREAFLTKLRQTGARVEYFGVIYDEKNKYEQLGGCHFGINMYKKNTNIGLTIKSIDYLGMGLPLLNTIAGDTRELIENYEVGINIEDPTWTEERIKTYVDDILNYKQKALRLFRERFDASMCSRRLRFLDEIIGEGTEKSDGTDTIGNI